MESAAIAEISHSLQNVLVIVYMLLFLYCVFDLLDKLCVWDLNVDTVMVFVTFDHDDKWLLKQKMDKGYLCNN